MTNCQIRYNTQAVLDKGDRCEGESFDLAEPVREIKAKREPADFLGIPNPTCSPRHDSEELVDGPRVTGITYMSVKGGFIRKVYPCEFTFSRDGGVWEHAKHTDNAWVVHSYGGTALYLIQRRNNGWISYPCAEEVGPSSKGRLYISRTEADSWADQVEWHESELQRLEMAQS